MSEFDTLVDVATVAAHLGHPGWVLVDCRFVLGDPGAGRRAWATGTIEGARYADLDTDLSGPIVPGVTGRHPLPEREAFAERVGQWGIDGQTQVVAFDDKGGAFASRLWWMLRWLGHDRVAVLDGGLPAWEAAGHGHKPGVVANDPRGFELRPALVERVDAAEVLARVGGGGKSAAIFDARAADRYRGENERTDPVAGHIPGARSLPFGGNLDAQGHMRSREELVERWTTAIAPDELPGAIAYCGSGVTACHNLLAIAHAGLPLPRLYPGSWSEWITDPSRPRATGDEA